MEISDMKVKDVSVETLKKFIEQKEKGEEEDYCVESVDEISIDKWTDSIDFNNNCCFKMDPTGDGLYIEKRFVKYLYQSDGSLHVILKGTNFEPSVSDRIVWENKE